MADQPLPTPESPAKQPTGRRILRRLLAVAGWVCLVTAGGAWLLLRFGDAWAPATAAMFAPLPLLALPPAALAAVAAVAHRRALRTLVPALLLTAGPVAGFCVPWDRLGADPPGRPLRVLTCNMHYAKLPAGPLDRLIDEAGPEVVVLQEWRESNRSEVLAGRGWEARRLPGHFLATRYPVRRAELIAPNATDARGSVARFEVETPAGVLTVFSAHFASPRDALAGMLRRDFAGLDANSDLRRAQSRHLADEANRAANPVLVVGDFNTPPHSAIFREVWGDYDDAFASAGWGWGHTFSARPSSVRIDYILTRGTGKALRCWIGPPVGSPHRPVLADVAWPPGG